MIILENKETGYAITDDHPGTVVLHGLGLNVAAYNRITWIHTAETLIYWGDIDLPGLDFVNDLRAYGIPATTVLMDTDTLRAFQHLATDGSVSKRAAAPHLNDSEAELYEQLRLHAANHQTGILLEQERIPWHHAYATLQSRLQIACSRGIQKAAESEA